MRKQSQVRQMLSEAWRVVALDDPGSAARPRPRSSLWVPLWTQSAAASSCWKAHCFPRLGAEGLQRIMENYGITTHPALRGRKGRRSQYLSLPGLTLNPRKQNKDKTHTGCNSIMAGGRKSSWVRCTIKTESHSRCIWLRKTQPHARGKRRQCRGLGQALRSLGSCPGMRQGTWICRALSPGSGPDLHGQHIWCLKIQWSCITHTFSLHGSKPSQGNKYDWLFRRLLHSIPASCWAKDVIKPETASEGGESWGRKLSGFKGLRPLKRNQKPCPMCNDSFIHPPKDVEELNEDKGKQRSRKSETLIN